MDIKIRVPGRGVARYEKQKIVRGEQKLFNINLQEGVTFRAVVKDSVTGKPVEGIVLFHYQHKGTEATSNAEGILEVPAMFPGSFEFNVTAVGEDRMRTSVAGNYARWWSPEALKPYQREYKGERDGFQRNFDGLEFDIADSANPCDDLRRAVCHNHRPRRGSRWQTCRRGDGHASQNRHRQLAGRRHTLQLHDEAGRNVRDQSARQRRGEIQSHRPRRRLSNSGATGPTPRANHSRPSRATRSTMSSYG